MAWEDILEAIATGGSRGIGEYMSMREAERDRMERERQRQEDLEMRRRGMDLQERQIAAAAARDEEERRRNIEQAMSRGELRETRDVLNLGAIRQDMPEAEGIGGAEGLFTGRGIGMAAKAAPGQTYAARRQEMEEQEAPAISRTPMSFLDEVPEFEPSETFREAGTREFEGRSLRPTTPEERLAMSRESESAQRLAGIEVRKSEAEQMGLEPNSYAYNSYVYGEDIVQPRGEVSSRIQDVERLVEMGVSREDAINRVFPRGGGVGGGAAADAGNLPTGAFTSLMTLIGRGKEYVDETGMTRTRPYTQQEEDELIRSATRLYRMSQGLEQMTEPNREPAPAQIGLVDFLLSGGRPNNEERGTGAMLRRNDGMQQEETPPVTEEEDLGAALLQGFLEEGGQAQRTRTPTIGGYSRNQSLPSYGDYSALERSILNVVLGPTYRPPSQRNY